MHTIISLTIFAVMACVTGAQSDAEIFLGPAGNDATGDGSSAAPFASFDKAISTLGDQAGSIVFLPGDYSVTTMYIPNRPAAGLAGLTVKSSAGKASVRIHSTSGTGEFMVGISAANVALQELQFYASSPKIVLAEMSARNLTIRNCVFNQSSVSEGSTSIVIDGNLAPSLSNVLIQSNTFIEPKHAVLEILKPVEALHFIGNTAHLPGSAHGLFVPADGYSGIVVSNNIFQYENVAYGRTVLLFDGKGKGSRINLNCFSSGDGITSVNPASKLATNSLLNLQLPFRDLDASDPDPGASLRGSCFDVFSQEKLSVLRRP